MEYIKKEELIIGEIYKSNKYNHIFKYQSINGDTNINISCNYRHFNRGDATIGHGLDNIINTTSEEKHWLNECIKLDKFITFEEAMKTFIPEYIECIKEVIEPLPQFKVIETIETIIKVENNEGNQFFIGDTVKSLNSEQKGKIVEFKYSANKSNIIAITTFQSNNGIGIDKIEHYIEPKTDYKILEYKTEGGISCKAPFLADSHQFYINERCKIYSIKRISDDLIITVGDEVLSKTCGVPNKILSIELINNKIRLYPRNSFYNLEDIIKVKLAY